MAREHAQLARHDGVARLVEAEREWAHRLDLARAEASTIVHEAETDARRYELSAVAHIDAAVAARRDEQQRCTDEAVRAAERQSAAAAARFANVPDAEVDRLAALVAGAAPWFTADDTEIES
jgi:hypothetical protein